MAICPKKHLGIYYRVIPQNCMLVCPRWDPAASTSVLSPQSTYMWSTEVKRAPRETEACAGCSKAGIHLHPRFSPNADFEHKQVILGQQNTTNYWTSRGHWNWKSEEAISGANSRDNEENHSHKYRAWGHRWWNKCDNHLREVRLGTVLV